MQKDVDVNCRGKAFCSYYLIYFKLKLCKVQSFFLMQKLVITNILYPQILPLCWWDTVISTDSKNDREIIWLNDKLPEIGLNARRHVFMACFSLSRPPSVCLSVLHFPLICAPLRNWVLKWPSFPHLVQVVFIHLTVLDLQLILQNMFSCPFISFCLTLP